MPTNTDSFWQTAEDWSQRKHLILSYYLEPAAPKLRTVSEDGRVIVVDGFAGRGKYEDGAAGSPIYMGQLAEKCQGWKSPVDLRIFNIEPDEVSYEELCRCTEQWVRTGSVTNLKGKFQERLAQVLQDSGSSPLFAFLDPFRPSHLFFDDFIPLLHRTAPTELCFVFHTPSLIRMIAALHPNAHTHPQTKSSLRDTVNQILGNTNWMSLLENDSINPDLVVESFTKEITRRCSGQRQYICSKGIEARYGVGLKYHIIFATRHRDGVMLMNGAFHKEGHTSYEQTGRSSQLSLFDNDNAPPIEMRTEQRQKLLENLLSDVLALEPSRVWKRKDLIFQMVRQSFGQFSSAEHRQTIDRLLHSKPPRIQALNKKPTKAGRWMTNEDTMIRAIPST